MPTASSSARSTARRSSRSGLGKARGSPQGAVGSRPTPRTREAEMTRARGARSARSACSISIATTEGARSARSLGAHPNACAQRAHRPAPRSPRPSSRVASTGTRMDQKRTGVRGGANGCSVARSAKRTRVRNEQSLTL